MDSKRICNIFILLIFLSSQTFAQVEFVTKPPEEVKTFPWYTVTLPCVLKNLNEYQHTVEWAQIEIINSTESKKTISRNRDVLITNLENFGDHFSILGDGMNYTLQFTIPKYSSINFGTYLTVTTFFRCSVVKEAKDICTATTNVIIQKSTTGRPICGTINTSNIIGETIRIGCYNSSNPTIITTLKSGKIQVLPTKYHDHYTLYYLTLTKEDHNAMFVCESRRNGTNEVQSCSMGPITVNYKPEININQISPMEFHCEAKARPPVNETHWIVEPSLPKESFTISNSILTFTNSRKITFKINISCEAENSIGKGIKTLTIPVVNNQKVPVVVIVVIVVLCVVVVFVIMILLFLKQNKNQCKQKSRNANSDILASNDDHQVTEFHADYKEKANEIYVASDRLSDGGSNTPNQSLSYKKLVNLDEYNEKENEIYVGANMNRDSEEKVMKDEYDYTHVNTPDYRECENEIYEGPE